MAKQSIVCPVCHKAHTVEVFKSGGKPVSIVSTECSFSTENTKEMEALLGIRNAAIRRSPIGGSKPKDELS